MGRLRVGLRRARGIALLMAVWAGVPGCSKPVAEEARAAERDRDPTAPCARDEAREYFCDDLLPLSSSRPAPEPYDNCPGAIDIRASSYPPVGHVAGFDVGFTEYTRKRVQPGHSCCYSWCTKVSLSDPGKAAPQQCRDAYGMRESFCMRELEGGTTEPFNEPFERCPAAVKPPEVAVFAAPTSALLDSSATAQRRQDTRLPDCCYGWCSKAPPGTMLKTHPKMR